MLDVWYEPLNENSYTKKGSVTPKSHGPRVANRSVSRPAALFDDVEALSQCLGCRQQVGVTERMSVLPLVGLLVPVGPSQGNPVGGEFRPAGEVDKVGENSRRNVAVADSRYGLGR